MGLNINRMHTLHVHEYLDIMLGSQATMHDPDSSAREFASTWTKLSLPYNHKISILIEHQSGV